MSKRILQVTISLGKEISNLEQGDSKVVRMTVKDYPYEIEVLIEQNWGDPNFEEALSLVLNVTVVLHVWKTVKTIDNKAETKQITP